MTFGSVCSGIEAASAAWEPLGMRPAWFAEVDAFPSAVLAHHWPDVANLGDMTTIAAMVRAGAVERPDVLVGGTPCFPAGQMVLTDRGYRPIEQLRPGDLVVTDKGRLQPIVRVGSKQAKVGRLVGVGQPDGILTTADHPFRSVSFRVQNTKRNGAYARVEHLGEPEWTPARGLPGLQWCALTSFDVEPPALPTGFNIKEAMYLAGFYLGDGWVRRWKGSNKKSVVFGINEAKLEKLRDRMSFKINALPERTGPRVTLGGTALAEWLIENFGEKSHSKKLPAWALSHPERQALLDGYVDTDGHLLRSGFRIASTSSALAYGVRDLVQTLGMVGSVRFVKTPDTCHIEGREVSQRDYWTISATRDAASPTSRRRHSLLLRKTKSFRELGERAVYNIEVATDHTYLVNGVVVHNCQSFSVAGLRNGLADERGGLTLEFVKLANEIDPKFTVWENVPGVLSSKDNAFGCFLGALAGSDGPLDHGGKRWSNAGVVLGPQRAVAWRVLDAQHFGVPQRRRRVFVVACPRGGADPSKILFEFEGVRRDTPPSREERQAVAGFATSGVGYWREGLGPLRARQQDSHESAVCGLNARQDPDSWPDRVGPLDTDGGTQAVCVTGSTTHTLKAEGHDGSEDGTGRGTPIVAFSSKDCGGDAGPVSPTLRASGHSGSHANGGVPPAVAYGITLFGSDGTARAADFTETAGSLRTKPPGSIENSSTTAALSGGAVRRLTPTECERLQGFRDRHTLVPYRGKPAADGPRYKACGNSMAVPVMRWLGARLILGEGGLL